METTPFLIHEKTHLPTIKEEVDSFINDPELFESLPPPIIENIEENKSEDKRISKYVLPLLYGGMVGSAVGFFLPGVGIVTCAVTGSLLIQSITPLLKGTFFLKGDSLRKA